VEFCNRFDEQLARHGPAGVFLFDHKDRLRFDASWTRDVWQRGPNQPNRDWTWVLMRDRDSGFVQLALITSSDLIREHPRLQLRSYPSLEAARSARRSIGAPPIALEAW
jgi:hypothetical protein